MHELVAIVGRVLTACGFISNASVSVIAPVFFTTFFFSIAFVIVRKFALGLIRRTAKIGIFAPHEIITPRIFIRAAWVANGDAIFYVLTPFFIGITTVIIFRNTFLKDFAPFLSVWVTAVFITVVDKWAIGGFIRATVLRAVLVGFTPVEAIFFVTAFLIRAKASCVTFIINIMAANLSCVISALVSRFTIYL